MTSLTRMDSVLSAADAGVFQDEDTLVMTIPATLDLSLYTTLRHFLRGAGRDGIRHILLDLSKVKTLCPSGIAAFRSLGKLAEERYIRVLMLDPPAGICQKLASLLADTPWLDVHQPESGEEPATRK
ncbi:MAG: STAS domain-containing protein, partial [Gammaproteobacteria bacterium]